VLLELSVVEQHYDAVMEVLRHAARDRRRPHRRAEQADKGLGCQRVVLHSTDMAVGVYRRARFVEHCMLAFYATAPIWSDKRSLSRRNAS
jgi:hypothetical protein